MMMAKMHENMSKHFCHKDDVNDIISDINYVDFTSEPEKLEKLNEEAGLSFKQNTPEHLRGLKDFEIEFVLSQKKRRRA